MLLMQFSLANADFPSIDTWTPEEIRAHIGFMGDSNGKLTAAGELVDGQGLAGADQAKIVRGGNGGAAVVTEGPFAETKEFLAGYWIVDTDTPERAVEIAAELSAAPGPGGRPLNMPIEVRPVMSAPPQEI
ncbi:YciI family protein [Micromonospora sp. NBC_01796]|uniref:YciI family protein n=1 Tax=Micromonospora sp. NBC_01796 TaxID=2975987 RepID=UPI002DDB0334|nr:YciI family protein [Micromonospora sp. NBC_01796]WSA89671.1 YciI family protein [Micromonospora sp. NBC_01796]